jgi:hypothetical protein
MKVNEMVTDLARAFHLGHSVLHCTALIGTKQKQSGLETQN